MHDMQPPASKVSWNFYKSYKDLQYYKALCPAERYQATTESLVSASNHAVEELSWGGEQTGVWRAPERDRFSPVAQRCRALLYCRGSPILYFGLLAKPRHPLF